MGKITATVDGNNKLVLTGTTSLSDFTLTDPAGNAEGLAANTPGTEGTMKRLLVEHGGTEQSFGYFRSHSGWCGSGNIGCRRGPRYGGANARQPWRYRQPPQLHHGQPINVSKAKRPDPEYVQISPLSRRVSQKPKFCNRPAPQCSANKSMTK